MNRSTQSSSYPLPSFLPLAVSPLRTTCFHARHVTVSPLPLVPLTRPHPCPPHRPKFVAPNPPLTRRSGLASRTPAPLVARGWLPAPPLRLSLIADAPRLTPGLHRLHPHLPLHQRRQAHRRHRRAGAALPAPFGRVDKHPRLVVRGGYTALCGRGGGISPSGVPRCEVSGAAQRSAVRRCAICLSLRLALWDCDHAYQTTPRSTRCRKCPTCLAYAA
jgi:hypothetical protein